MTPESDKWTWAEAPDDGEPEIEPSHEPSLGAGARLDNVIAELARLRVERAKAMRAEEELYVEAKKLIQVLERSVGKPEG